jgi:hypothetical protein
MSCNFKKATTYTLAGFDLTTHISNLLNGRQRRYHYKDHAARALIMAIMVRKK